jgi:hypothetical protein
MNSSHKIKYETSHLSLPGFALALVILALPPNSIYAQKRVCFDWTGFCIFPTEDLLEGSTFAEVAWLLLRIDMPDDVVRKTDDLVACSLGHLSETLGLGLVFECVAWEVNACIVLARVQDT